MPEQEAVPSKLEDSVKALPEQLQALTLDFMRKLAKNMIAQQTTGESGETRVTPDQVEFYQRRFGELLDSGFLNPHVRPLKKISE